VIWIFWLTAATCFAHVYRIMHRYLRTNVPGLGWLMRRIGKDLVLEVHGVKTYMYSPIAGSNAMHLIGRWNEPETHWFLASVLKGHPGGVTFIDVGANIGEMALDLARHPAVSSVIAFEPVPSCYHSLTVSAAVNELENLTLRPCAVSAEPGVVQFKTSTTNPSSSGIAGSGDTQIEVEATTLDMEFCDPLEDPIVLLDVEGAEHLALRGGQKLIARDRPLIIFEFNQVSRQHFNLDMVRTLLGPAYEIYRLRTSDGLLDLELTDTWNCIAVHRDTRYYERCLSLIFPRRG
jgi:FkbM family methyltransferase